MALLALTGFYNRKEGETLLFNFIVFSNNVFLTSPNESGIIHSFYLAKAVNLGGLVTIPGVVGCRNSRE